MAAVYTLNLPFLTMSCTPAPAKSFRRTRQSQPT